MKQRFRSHLVQATQVAPVRPAYSAGLRAAIATVGPLIAGSALGWQNAAWMGLAGFNVALVDKGGTLRTRLGAMLPAAFYGTLAATMGAIAGRYAIVAVLLFVVWAIASGIARTYGATAISIGILSLATLVVSMEQPAPSLADAFDRGGAILAGALFAIALSLLLGRFRLYRPARLAVADVYRALAELASGFVTEDVRIHEAVAHARRLLTQLRRGMQGESPRGEQLLVLLEGGNRIAALLTNDHVSLAPLLLRIAEAIEREEAPLLENVAEGILHEPLESAIAALHDLQNDEEAQKRNSLRARYLDPLRGTFSWSSTLLRHALRVALAGGIAVALTRSLHVERGYWLTLTIVVVLQPYTSATLQRGLQRVAGTVAGAIVAALLLSVLHTPAQMMIVVFVGAALTVALLPLNYALFSLVLTPTFVLLAEVHTIDRHLVWLRVNNTLYGAALSLLAAWLLWPASEKERLFDELAAALRALAELTRCTAECDEQLRAEAERAFGLTVANAEASLQRVLSDTKQSDADAAEEASMAVLIYARRFAAALQKLAARNAEAATRVHFPVVARFASGTLLQLADAVAEKREPLPMATRDRAGKSDEDLLLEPLASLHSAVDRVRFLP